LLILNYQKHIYWKDPFLTATYIINRLPSKALNNKSPFELQHILLIVFPPKLLTTNPRLNWHIIKNQTTYSCVFFDVLVGQIYMLAMNTKLFFILKLVFFLVTISQTKATNVLTWPRVKYLFLAMLFFMSLCFHMSKSRTCPLLLPHISYPYQFLFAIPVI